MESSHYTLMTWRILIMMKDRFHFKTNEEFVDYIDNCESDQLMKLYRHTQHIMNNGKDVGDSAAAMIDLICMYRRLINQGFSRKDLI